MFIISTQWGVPHKFPFGQKGRQVQGIQMQIFLTGVSCVGKTTIGKKIGELLGIKFFDLDQEIENLFETSIEGLQDRFFTIHSFRKEAAKALVHLLNRPDSRECVVALLPSGLMGGTCGQ
jgi:shikimate kinase